MINYENKQMNFFFIYLILLTSTPDGIYVQLCFWRVFLNIFEKKKKIWKKLNFIVKIKIRQ